MNDELKKLDEIVSKNRKYVRYVTIVSIAVVLVGIGALVLKSANLKEANSTIEDTLAAKTAMIQENKEVVDSLKNSEVIVNAAIKDTVRNIIDRFLQEKNDSAAYRYYADTVENYFDNQTPFTFDMILQRKKLRGRDAKIIYKKDDIIVTVKDNGIKEVILDAQYSSNPEKYPMKDLIYDFKLNADNKIFSIRSREGKKYEGDL